MRKRRRRKTEEVDGEVLPSQEELRAEEEVMAAAEAPLTILGRLVTLLPVIICFLGTGRNPWVAGGVAITVGLLALLAPVRQKLPYSMLLLSAGVLIFGFASLLPLPPALVPPWRQALVGDLYMNLSASWSAQPWVTIENGAWLLVLLLWFNWGTAFWQLSSGRSQALRLLSLGLVALGTVSLILHAIQWEPATWQYGEHRDIGPFANRNHFACLMAMAAVLCLACAYDLLRRRKRAWAIYGLGVLPCFAAVLIAGSRAGLALFGMGVVLWLSAAALRKRSVQRLAISGAVLLGLTTGAVLFGQKLLQRFSNHGSLVENITEEGRWPIHAATFDLILQNPLLGAGLGNFAAVFGMTNKIHEGFVRFRHPESDWLWFAAEAGWPATLCLLAGTFLLLLWMGPWRNGAKSAQRRERRLRLSCGIALFLPVVHGIFDVPNHDLPMAMVVGMLAAMALYHEKVGKASGAVLPNVLRGAGVLSIAAGIAWLATGLGMNHWMGQSAVQRYLAEAKAQSAAGDAAKAWKAVNEAVEAAPLSWEVWFVRGETGLKLGHPSSDVLLDFARSRYLEPNIAINCMLEADHWLRRDPMMAVPAWREALNREPTLQVDRYFEMLKASEILPDLKQAVRELASSARLLLAYMSTVQGSEFESARHELLQRYPALQGLNAAERYRLFELWNRHGNRQQLTEALSKHEDWQTDGWSFLSAELAAKGDFQKAVTLAQRFMTTSINLPAEAVAPLEQLLREFSLHPSDARRGFNLYVAQREAKKYDEALTTLQSMAGQPTAPKSIYFEMSKVYTLKSDYEKAWEMISRYLQG